MVSTLEGMIVCRTLFELIVSASVGLKSYLDRFGWLTHKLKTKHTSEKRRLSDFEVPT